MDPVAEVAIAFFELLSSIERPDGEKEERRSDHWEGITWSQSMIFRFSISREQKKRPPGKPETAFEKVKTRSDLLDFRDSLKDTRSDSVRISLGVWTTIFKVALPVVLGEGVWDANGCSAVGNAPRELVD